MVDDAELLHRYIAEGSEDAFRELVQRHLNLVYGAALRRTNGDTHRAEDVTQIVFTDMARQARKLSTHRALTAWLYATTRNVAIKVMLSEKRRQAREYEQVAEAGQAFVPEPTIDWDRIHPILDNAMDELGGKDREAILLRFFEGRSFKDVSEIMTTSEDSARMRVTRALEKLRDRLARRGVNSTAAALAVLIAGNIATKTPGGLANGVSNMALAGKAAATGSIGVEVLGLFTGGKIIVTALALAALLSMGLFTSRQVTQRRVSANATQLFAKTAKAASDAQLDSAASRSGTGSSAPEAVFSLAEILAEKDQIKAFALYTRRVLQLKPDEFESELRALLGVPKPEQHDTFIRMLLKEWGKVEPLAGIAAITRLQDTPGTGLIDADFMTYKTTILKGWIVDKPDEAWDWASGSLSDFDWAVARRMRSGLGVFPARGIGTPAVPVDLETSTRLDFRRGRLMELLPELSASGQYTKAAELIAHSPSDVVTWLVRPFALTWATVDIKAAADWIQNDYPTGLSRTDAIAGFVEAVASESPETADGFLKTLSDPGEVRAGAEAMIKGFTAVGDRSSAFAWLQKTAETNESGLFDQAIVAYERIPATGAGTPEQESEQRDLIAKTRDPAALASAYGSYYRRLLASSPTDAIEAAKRFLPAQNLWKDYRTSGSMGSLVSSWATNDFQAAKAYVDSLPNLTEEQQGILNSALDLGHRTAGK